MAIQETCHKEEYNEIQRQQLRLLRIQRQRYCKHISQLKTGERHGFPHGYKIYIA